MTFPQLNPAGRLSRLAARIVQSKSVEEAKGIISSVQGAVMQSKLKRKVMAERKENTLPLGSSGDSINHLSTLFQRDLKVQSFKQPNSQLYLAPRQAKWQLISDNLAKMDEVTMREYRERRREGKSKAKKNNYPF